MRMKNLSKLPLLGVLVVAPLAPGRLLAQPPANPPLQLFFTDAGTGTVDEYAIPSGTFSTYASGLGFAAGIVANPAGGFLVASSFNTADQISQVVNGVASPYVTLGNVSGAFGLAVNPQNNNLYAGNYFNNAPVQQITPAPAKTVSTYTLNTTNAQGLAFDGNGNLYVSEFYAGDVIKITPGGVSSVFASGLSTPEGLAFDNSGNLYVANFGGNDIIKVPSSGGTGSVYYSGALVNKPNGLAVDGNGNVYVTSQGFGAGNNTVAEIYSGGLSGLTLVNGLNNPEFITIVPEPSAPALLAAGAAGLLLRRRRQA
jgi:streptogramin lyase